MVKTLTPADEAAIHEAIGEAGRRTAAKISVVIHPVSGHYGAFTLLYGFLLGTVVSLGLWLRGINSYPLLLAAQGVTMLAVDMIPWLHRACIALVPQHIRHHFGGEAARHEYAIRQATLTPDAPFILLFVSLAERYVHIVTSPAVHQKIPGNWDTVTNRFIERIHRENLRAASLETIRDITEIAATHFPPE